MAEKRYKNPTAINKAAIASAINRMYIPVSPKGFTHSKPKYGKNNFGLMYISYTQPFAINLKMEVSIKKPKAILKTASGARCTGFKKYDLIWLITVSVLVSNNNA